MFASFQIVQKTIVGFLAFCAAVKNETFELETLMCVLIRIPQVDQVTSVWEDYSAGVSELFHPRFERRDGFIGETRRGPFTLRLEKDGESIGPGEFRYRAKVDTELVQTHPISAAFNTAFSSPPAADTCAPTFQGVNMRSGIESLSISCLEAALLRFFGTEDSAMSKREL